MVTEMLLVNPENILVLKEKGCILERILKKYVDFLSTIYRTTRQNVSKNIEEYKEQYHQPAEPNRHLWNTPSPK